MNNFYGGMPGQNFSIVEIFNTKVSLDRDLDMGWHSPISVGEYVEISYGLPSDSTFDTYLADDLREYGKSYNSTLWQKCYDESTPGRSAKGLSYRLIASMTGNTPKITFTKPPEKLHADEDPDITVDSTNIDNPKVTFWLPVSQVIRLGTVISGHVTEDPRVEIDDQGVNAQGDAKIDFPELNLWLPRAQQLQQGNLTIVDPMSNPLFNITYQPGDEVNQDKPYLNFELPRAVRFFYGGLLGSRTNGPFTLTTTQLPECSRGDYYINQSTGFIYLCTNKDDTTSTLTFEYVACIQAPLPEIATEWVDPFNSDGSQKTMPSIKESFTDPVERTGWKLTFYLPKIPKFQVGNVEFIGSADNRYKIDLNSINQDTMEFDFKIPGCSRMFAGTDVQADGPYDVFDAIVGGALPGDLYLNTKTGAVYKLDRSGIWKFQNDGLKGPVGDSLNIVRHYTIDTGNDTLTEGVNYIVANYVDGSGNPLPYKPDEIFAVTYIDRNDNDKETSYWYFYTEDGVWGRVQLTGGVNSLIFNTYTDSPASNPITNKTYSVDYINKLIGGNITPNNADKTTFSKDQIYALFTWGTFDEAKNGSWWPAIGQDHDALSAEEILRLASWGSIASLVIKQQGGT